MIEPIGLPPALIVLDLTEEDFEQDEEISIHKMRPKSERQSSWPPLKSRLLYYRERVITSLQLVLTHVALKLNNGEYNLDKWRRLLPNMKPKIFYKPPEYYE